MLGGREGRTWTVARHKPMSTCLAVVIVCHRWGRHHTCALRVKAEGRTGPSRFGQPSPLLHQMPRDWVFISHVMPAHRSLRRQP
jgi:hypothetical protein